MSGLRRQANRFQFDSLVEAGLVKEFPQLNFLAVLSEEGVDIEVPWTRKFKRRTKDGKEKEYVRNYRTTNHYPRGVLLFPHWGAVSPEEAEEYKNLPEDELKQKRIFRGEGKISILRVMCIGDLPKAIRQRKRHIVGGLVGLRRGRFLLKGDAVILADYADRLSEAIKPLLAAEPPPQALVERTSKEFLEDWQELSNRKTWLINQAREEMLLACQQGRFWEIAVHGSKALSSILEERARKYEMAVKSWVLGERWQILYGETRQKFKSAYERMGKLIMELEKAIKKWKRTGVTPAIGVIQELHGIYLHLINVDGSYFDPFCARVNSDEFQRLNKILILAEAGKWSNALRVAREAHSKIELFAMGEVPGKKEDERQSFHKQG